MITIIENSTTKTVNNPSKITFGEHYEHNSGREGWTLIDYMLHDQIITEEDYIILKAEGL